MKLAIFEENGSEHGLRRALVHAGVLGICREQGDFLLSSTMSRDGRSIVLHLVNADRQAKPISLFFSDGSAWKVTVVTTLNGDGPLADNVPEAMSRVVPQDRTEEFLRTAQLPACSYTVIVCERSDTGLL